MRNAKTVDEYFETDKYWIEEQRQLREILLATGLEESIKWGGPVYTLQGKNIVGLGGFKGYFGLWFFQGALLSDPARRLINAQEGKTEALRQLRFGSAGEIDRELIFAYVSEAVENQRAGREIKPAKKPLMIPDELEAAFAGDRDLRTAFEALGLGKKRDFAEYVGGAKRAETRARRLQKVIPMIREARGLNDTYK